jgi:L-rhamnose mutarotase
MAGLILKVDTDGNVLWHKLYEGTIDYPTGKIYSAIASKDGIVAAGSISSEEKTLGRVLKTDLNGNMIWSNTYSYLEHNGINADYSIFKTSNGYTVFQYLSNQTTGIHNQVKILNIDTTGNAQSQTLIINNHFDSHYFSQISNGFVMLGNNQNEREPGRDVVIAVWLINISSS